LSPVSVAVATETGDKAQALSRKPGIPGIPGGNKRESVHFYENYFYGEDLVCLYEEKFTLGIKSSGSWSSHGVFVTM
jgi:hypothetical protein